VAFCGVSASKCPGGIVLAVAFRNTMANAPSLPRTNEVPAAPASDTHAIADKVPESGPVAAAGTIEGDWPTLAVLSRRYIDRALGHTNGNKTRAADLLGIDRRTLNRILARERARKAAKAAE
jgi:DNA-binding NtrC family response regulator